MDFYHGNRQSALDNTDFRKVVYTAKNIQIVLMSVPPGTDVGEEVHERHDQTFVFMAGEGKVVIGKQEVPVEAGDVVLVPLGVYHNVRSLGPGDLKLYSLCTPPHHQPGTVHPTLRSAVPDQEH